MKINSKCLFTCPQGYQLQGPSFTRCESGGQWTESASVSCTGDFFGIIKFSNVTFSHEKVRIGLTILMARSKLLSVSPSLFFSTQRINLRITSRSRLLLTYSRLQLLKSTRVLLIIASMERLRPARKGYLFRLLVFKWLGISRFWDRKNVPWIESCMHTKPW